MVRTDAYICSVGEFETLLNSKLPDWCSIELEIDFDGDDDRNKMLCFRFIVPGKRYQRLLYRLAKRIAPMLDEGDLELDTDCYRIDWYTVDFEIHGYMYDFVKETLGFDWDYWIDEENNIIIFKKEVNRYEVCTL